MKTAISIPDDIFRAAETFAHQSRLSRSALFTRALVEFLSRRRNEGVTERLNRLYSKEESRLDATLSKMQTSVISKEKW
jgi:metal-responsive CopG/Arc/MetJ family transcriptional regulator